MLDMAFQAHDLFVHADLISVNRNLRGNPALFHLRVRQKLFYFLCKLFPVLCHNLRGTLLHISHMLQQFIQLYQQVPLQILSLSDTGLHKLLTGSFHSLLQQLPELFLVLLDLFHNKDFRISGKRAYLHILFQMELFRHLIQILQILRGQRLVIPQSRVRLGQILIGDKYVHLAPLYIRLQKAADG